MTTYTQNLYSLNGNYPEERPTVILTQENTTIDVTPDTTDSVLESSGYIRAPDCPDIIKGQVALWNGTGWTVEEKTEIENQRLLAKQWANVRKTRDQLLRLYEWKYVRNSRETRLGLPTTDNLQELDAYMQALADITNCSDPNNITWPPAPASFDTKE
jgi:hypothetical protein